MKNNKFFIWTAVATVVLLLGGLYYSNQQMKSSQSLISQQEDVTTSLSVSETTYDWGEIGIDDGDVTATFEITNEGDQPLQLSRLITSCSCTTAQLKMPEEESPLFGMHNKSAYIFEVPPQETAILEVVFDPAFHGPNGTGPVTRQVTMVTNDPLQSQLQFSLSAMVVK